MSMNPTHPESVGAASTAADLAARAGVLSDEQLTERFRELELAERRLATERSLLVADADRRNLHYLDNHHSLAGWLRAHANWSPTQVTAARRSARLLRASRPHCRVGARRRSHGPGQRGRGLRPPQPLETLLPPSTTRHT